MLRLFAAATFAVIPALALPIYSHYLYSIRPTVTDVRAGFVNPHFHDGVAHYFAHADETLLRGLAFWLLAAVLLLMFAGGQMMRRRLKQWLRPPPPEPAPVTDAETSPVNPV